jgi:hypothetical protein
MGLSIGYIWSDIDGVGAQTLGKKEEAGTGARLEFKWGTFCRMVLQEPDTKETSLVGVMPGLDVTIGVLEGQESTKLVLPITLCVHAVFRVVRSPKEAGFEPFEAVLSLNELNMTMPLNVEVKPNDTHASINLRLLNPGGLPLVAGLQTFSVGFRHNGKYLDKIELPISVKVAIIPNPSDK